MFTPAEANSALTEVRPAADLRKDVTSPGGTTEAALALLMAPDGLTALMRRAVAAATARVRAVEQARLALVQGVVTVLASGLHLLGVEAPEEMR